MTVEEMRNRNTDGLDKYQSTAWLVIAELCERLERIAVALEQKPEPKNEISNSYRTMRLG